MALIRMENVSVSYGKHRALDGVSLDVDHGAVGLLGLNGAGKSTLIRTLLGFLRPARGEVEVFGLRLPRHALRVRQQLGYMPEREVLYPKVSAVSFLSYCGCLLGMSRVDAMERAHEVLDYVGLGANRYGKMETYSAGTRQRVKFAQALIHDPRLLLLDEPTTGLDPGGRAEMLRLIRELAAGRKVTVLFSSHLLPDVEQVCDRVIMIHEGRIVEDSRVEDLTARREGVYEVQVRDNQDRFIEDLTSAGYSCRSQEGGLVTVVQPEGESERRLFETAQACGTQVRHFRKVRHRLEEVFLRAIGRG